MLTVLMATRGKRPRHLRSRLLENVDINVPQSLMMVLDPVARSFVAQFVLLVYHRSSATYRSSHSQEIYISLSANYLVSPRASGQTLPL